MMATLGANLVALGLALLIASTATLLGMALLRGLRLNPGRDLLGWVGAFALGSGILSHVVLGLGLLDLYRPVVAWLLLALLVVAAAWQLLHHRQGPASLPIATRLAGQPFWVALPVPLLVMRTGNLGDVLVFPFEIDL